VSSVKLAQFQEAAVSHIVDRLRDRNGSRRMLLADEVGLGKTIVARGVIQALLKGRRRPLTVIYLCSNAEIAEQNRQKLDPESRKPIGRVTELAIERPDSDADLLLYSFTPGTSLREGPGLAWERRLLLYLLHRIYDCPVETKRWREFLRCGAGEENWYRATTWRALSWEFERKTSTAFQEELATAWRAARLSQEPAVRLLKEMVVTFDRDSRDERTHRNRLVALLRGVMQRVALRHLSPDLVILDEVQRFRDVLDEAKNPQHIAAELFARRVPVLILSATPYRALTLAHELSDGAFSHHEDFFKTLEFLFDSDTERPNRIRKNLAQFGERLKSPLPTETLDHELLKLKRALEDDLTKVICRTERNWYVLDRKKGVDDRAIDSGVLPEKSELEEFFRLHKTLSPWVSMGQVTEFWKSAPSLLTFVDGQYHLFRTLRKHRVRVPRSLLSPPSQVKALAKRNHRISRAIDLALGEESAPPRLWAAPTYSYYRDDYFGPSKPRKVLVFSGWRFVPKTVAIVLSQVAAARLGNDPENPSQPLRFTEKSSFHVFDVCFPSLFLASIGDEAFTATRKASQRRAEDVVANAERSLRRHFRKFDIEVVSNGGQRSWQVVMRMEQHRARTKNILAALDQCVGEQEEGTAEHVQRHVEWVEEWLQPSRKRLQISEGWLKRLALVAAFSPAVSLVRACQSVYGEEETGAALPAITALCLGAMRRYFNRPHVQQVIRQHRFRLRWREMPSEDRGYAERVLVYAGDAHLQAVLDEYLYLLRNAAQAETAEKAVDQIGDVWTLSPGNPRTNGARGQGEEVQIDENAEVHSTHFALAFGEDISQDGGPDADDRKLRKSVVREAFNSPFWPFVLATTSVGQEGLDFHLYCRDVLHWNLPSNPVDLEQREGRINRRDCLAVRESIARDWPLSELSLGLSEIAPSRNPWPTVFATIESRDDVQKYKHGLFPHWVYECRNPNDTVRIRRHVPFFATSRDALRYERLKTGLALYRLVFGQANQEDLLEHLQERIEGLDFAVKDAMLKRLASYMLNLTPIRHGEALRHAMEESRKLCVAGADDDTGLRQLLTTCRQILVERATQLLEVKTEIEGLIRLVEQAVQSRNTRSSVIRKAVAALAYFRNPYDHIFDLHSEGGFVDDVDVIQKAWAVIRQQTDNQRYRITPNSEIPAPTVASS
jgi:uncharacterized membrane protein YkvA (DUF1232 family)